MNVKDKLDEKQELKRLVRSLSLNLLKEFSRVVEADELRETTTAWYEVEGFGKISMSVRIEIEED